MTARRRQFHPYTEKVLRALAKPDTGPALMLVGSLLFVFAMVSSYTSWWRVLPNTQAWLACWMLGLAIGGVGKMLYAASPARQNQ